MPPKKLKKREDKIRDKKRNLINILGIKDLFDKLPPNAKKPILDFTWPKPTISINENAKEFPGVDNVEDKIRERVSNLKIEVNGEEMPILDVGYVLGIDSAVHGMKSFLNKSINNDKAISKKITDPAALLSTLEKIENSTAPNARDVWFNSAIKLMYSAWLEVSDYYNFAKNGLYFTLVLEKSPGGKVYQNVIIHQYKTEVRIFNVDGKPRNGYLCFFFDAVDKFPIVFKKGTINNIKPVKVYIQDHAINRIKERLKITYTGDMFYSIGLSLINPKVACKDDDSYFLELHFNKNKVGYLIASFADDAVLIKSFKFITMSGTPEYQILKNKFKASRKDFEYLGMDTIDFINSDAFKDPELRQIFKSCNLSHLFELKKQLKFDEPEFSIADDIKKYFKL